MKSENTDTSGYVKRSKSNYLDLIFVLIITILSIISVISPFLNDSFVRIIFGLLFILFLPGYALIAALFPRIGDLDGIERVALSFGLSIVISALIGFALNYTPYGIRLTPVLTFLSVFTILMVFFAFLRRRNIPKIDRFSVDFTGFFNEIKSSYSNENRTGKILSIILVVFIIAAISLTVYAVAIPKEGEKFTEFYILNQNGNASNYPTTLNAGQSGTVIVGIVNHENMNVTYNLVVKLNNQILSSQNFPLINNQSIQTPVNFQVTNKGNNQKLEFFLYKLPDVNNTYRDLHLWINVN